MPKRADLTGKRFGRLVVGEYIGNRKWFATCDCGKQTTPRSNELTSGKTKSCGCYSQDLNHAIQHGKSKSLEFNTWANMIQRCHNATSTSYERYGARGIHVCDRWRESFVAFLADMGPRPSSDHSIDRIDNGRGYEPDNCRWATRAQQANNTRYRGGTVLRRGDKFAAKFRRSWLGTFDTPGAAQLAIDHVRTKYLQSIDAGRVCKTMN